MSDIYNAPENAKSLTSVSIPEGVTEIGSYVFNRCASLKEVVIPEGVTKIGNGAFYECKALKKVSIPVSMEEIGELAFGFCSSFKEIIIPECVKKIKSSAFSGCTSLKRLHLPASATQIGNSAFSGCSSLKEINLPEGMPRINGDTFYGCKSLRKIQIPQSVKKLGPYAFCDCSSLEEVHIPENVQMIEKYVFCNCSSLKKVNIPNGVTEIKTCTFEGCTSLEEISIPKSVTKIESFAFRGCTSLKKVNISNETTEIETCAFEKCTSLDMNSFCERRNGDDKLGSADRSKFHVAINKQFDNAGIPITIKYDAAQIISQINKVIDESPRIAPAIVIEEMIRKYPRDHWAIVKDDDGNLVGEGDISAWKYRSTTVGVKPECLTDKDTSKKILSDFLKAAEFLTTDVALRQVVASAPVKKDGHIAANRNALEITMDGVFEDASTLKLIGKTDKSDCINICLRKSEVSHRIKTFSGNASEYVKQNS